MHNILFCKTCINLDHVTNIKIREDGHIIFYWDYVNTKGGNTLPDKIYIDDGNLDFLENEYFKQNFKKYSEGKYINTSHICSMKYIKDESVCIVNMDYLHTYNTKENGKIEIPKYVKIKCTYEEFLEFCK